MNSTYLLKIISIGLSFLLFASGSAIAASDRSVNNIIRSLAPIKGQVITKGYGEKRKRTRIDDIEIIVDYNYSVDIEVYFPFNSAGLTRKSRRQLRALGRALSSSELTPFRYLIAGHTDARGSRAYNKALSKRRARAVKTYLISHYPISPNRLLAVGWGEDKLKSPRHPNAAINRRVQAIMIQSEDVSEIIRILPKKTIRIIPKKTIRIIPKKTIVIVPEKTEVIVREKTKVVVPEKVIVVMPEKTTAVATEKVIVVVPQKTKVAVPEKTKMGMTPGTLPPCTARELKDLDDFQRRPGIDCLATSDTDINTIIINPK